MPLVKVKPTSPGRRALVKVVTPELYKGDPHAPLVAPQRKGSGRNNYGRITMRHQGGGHKHHYRMIDFRRNKDGIQARVERIVYGAIDPKAGAVGSLWDVVRDRRLNHRPEVIAEVLAEECGSVLAEFFARRRVG